MVNKKLAANQASNRGEQFISMWFSWNSFFQLPLFYHLYLFSIIELTNWKAKSSKKVWQVIMLLKLILWFVFLKLSTSANDFTFNGFKGVNLNLDGAAVIRSDGVLMLTDLNKQHKGHGFYPIPISFGNTISSFSTTFVFVIVPEYLGKGCCGFAFTISASKDFSESMATNYMGLFNYSNNGNSYNHILAIEFDTVMNPEDKDIDSNHVGIDVNGLVSNKSITASYTSDDNGELRNLSLVSGNPMQVWIDYDHFDMKLNVTLAPFQLPRPSLPFLSTNIKSEVSDNQGSGLWPSLFA